ncbi:MAG TPA: hypothetical protein VEA81_03290 [Burkholderiaceae bacterium]|nr:hypothetical protein [Burkholderiaceae bacterium]
MSPPRPFPFRRPAAIAAAALLAVPLSGCIVAPLHPHRHYGPPPSAVYVPPPGVYAAPTYAVPAPGYHWSQHPRHGWGWRHPHRGWHRGWH